MSGQLAERVTPQTADAEKAPERLISLLAEGKANPTELSEVSRVMFARLDVLEEGAEEYQYVRNSLIELNMALVRFAAKRFPNRVDQMEDILQVGTIGLIKAVDRFTPGYGVEFTTFAMPTINGEIKHFFRDTSWLLRVPHRLQELRIDMPQGQRRLGGRTGPHPHRCRTGGKPSNHRGELRLGADMPQAATGAELGLSQMHICRLLA